jgi:hypothetical protein
MDVDGPNSSSIDGGTGSKKLHLTPGAIAGYVVLGLAVAAFAITVGILASNAKNSSCSTAKLASGGLVRAAAMPRLPQGQQPQVLAQSAPYQMQQQQGSWGSGGGGGGGGRGPPYGAVDALTRARQAEKLAALSSRQRVNIGQAAEGDSAAGARRAAKRAAKLPKTGNQVVDAANASEAAVTSKLGLSSLGASTSLGKVYQDTAGTHLGSGQATAVKAGVAGDLGETADVNRYLTKDQSSLLNKSLSLSGVPATFAADDVTAEKMKRAAIASALALEGHPDPTWADIAAATAPLTATRSLLQRQLRASSMLPVLEPVTRFNYDCINFGVLRPSTPMPTISSIVPDTISPGLANYMQEITCGAGGAT